MKLCSKIYFMQQENFIADNNGNSFVTVYKCELLSHNKTHMYFKKF